MSNDIVILDDQRKKPTKLSTSSFQAPLPQAPHPDTLKDPYMTIRSDERGQLICYCPRHRCGAVLHIEAGLWAIYCPLSLIEFTNTLGERGVMLPKGPDFETWLRAIAMATPTPAGDAPN